MGSPALMIAFGKPHKGLPKGDDEKDADASEHEEVAKDIIAAVKGGNAGDLAMALTRFLDLHAGGGADATDDDHEEG